LPNASILAGIKDTSFFKINSIGFRGDEKKDSDLVHIVAIGGSTTECLYLDQSETWPALLEKYLNKSSDKKIQVFNGGRSGLNSNHHLIQIQKLLENDNWIDVIIVLEGINDLQYALSLANDYKKEDPQTIYDKSFLVSPINNKLPFYKRTYLFMYLSKLKKALLSYKLAQDPFGNDYTKWRENRINASVIIDSMPNLDSSLSDFKKNNESMIDLAKSKKKRIIFLTQPVAWDYNMPDSQKKLCWFGWIGSNQNENDENYYSFSILKKSIERYNSLLKEICKERDVECIDIENSFSKDTTTFYDDCHFNESGANKLAKKISMFINSKI
jgi:lysophospholipase L1-like esterase